MFVNVEVVEKLLETQRVRAIAASSPQIAAGLPLIREVWPDLLLEGLGGIFVPARTPAERVGQINRDVNQVLADPAFHAQMRQSGQLPVGGSPKQFAQTVRVAYERYGELIRRLGLGVQERARDE
jgi:tripartite-type tricarboxylate transporter receptor subunit TctC